MASVGALVEEEAPATIYDKVVYPTALFLQTHPDRLAALARLNGLDPVPPESARVLEIGGGDCMNLLAMAVAYPDASFTGFDLAPTVIARGRGRAEIAGLANVRLEVLDILDAAKALPGPFDYVIAHGVYAWVPPHVREALMAYIGAVLSPRGIAFISYNCHPGGHFRMAVRDLMLHFVRDEKDPAKRIQGARNVLNQFSEPHPDDGVAIKAFRHQAKMTLDQVDGLMFHDELADVYLPQLHSDVTAAARSVGLAYLGDSSQRRIADAFLPEGSAGEGDVQAQIDDFAQKRDFAEMRYFRRSLFIRDDARPKRRLDREAVRTLWASTNCERLQSGDYRGEGGSEFRMVDPGLDSAMLRLVEARPGRLPVAELVDADEARIDALVQLFDRGSVHLHSGPAPYSAVLPEAPEVSPLARALIAEGMETVCKLDHMTVKIEDPVFRAFLGGLDGSRSGGGLEALAEESGFSDPGQWRLAADMALRQALIMLDSRA